MPSVQRSSSSSPCRLLASLYRSRFEVVAGRSDSPELHRPTLRAERQAGQAGKAFDPGGAVGAFGFSQQYISGLEQGRRNPTVVSLYELATALGVSHMELVRPSEGAT